RPARGQNAVTPIFVDSYVSYYGSSYNNFVVNDPDQGISNQALTNVVDVQLNPLPFTSFDSNLYSLEHEYAAGWYAGSAETASQPVGLLWSPLLTNPQTNVPGTSQQTWTDDNLSNATQFVLGASSSPNPDTPVFTSVNLQPAGNSPRGRKIGSPQGVSS